MNLSKQILSLIARLKISKRIMVLSAYLLCEWFLMVPDPLPMALFVFVAQPLFAFAGFIYILEVIEELKGRGVL